MPLLGRERQWERAVTLIFEDVESRGCERFMACWSSPPWEHTLLFRVFYCYLFTTVFKRAFKLDMFLKKAKEENFITDTA